jgi:DDE_Tnp_1-associated/Transposase DDE domain
VEEAFAKSRRRSLLEHFGAIKDTRQACKIMYSLREVLLLVVCATIASCDDYDEIVAWGEAHSGFLRRFLPYHWGIPCEDWLRVVMNRLDPDLFSACFTAWAAELRPEAIDLVAIKPAPAKAGGKTSRRSHDRSKGKKALHLVCAWASNERLVLGQEAVEEKSNEITAIPLLLERLAIKGALVTIDTIACNPTIAQDINDAGADYLLAVKSLPRRRPGTTSRLCSARCGATSIPRRPRKWKP